MWHLLKFAATVLRCIPAFFRTRNEQALIELALRQQLATCAQRGPNPRITPADRAFWAFLSRTWSGWKENLVIVQPDTCRILRKAVIQLSDCSENAIVVADSGSENVNGAIDDLLDDTELTPVLAQVDVTFSNSMIEAFWRSLKHSWLYLHSLDRSATLQRLIDFYVKAYNEVMPHSAFDGQTPDEMFFGTGDEVATELADARKTAREERLKANRSARCDVCTVEKESTALLLQRARSRM